MTRSPRFPATLAAVLPLGLLFAACAQDDADLVDLDAVNGGLTMDDEAPMFGAEAEFEAAALEGEIAIDDPLAEDTAVVTMIEAPDAAVYAALVVWGQMPPDRLTPSPRDWSGAIEVNRGALIIRRAVGFEDATDALAPRTAATTIEFDSVTRPFADGLALTVVDPEPASDEPLTLTYRGDDGVTLTMAVADLIGEPVSSEADALGNRMIAAAMPRPADACAYGFVRGRWHRTAPDRGALIGLVADQDGALVGHIRGLYGERPLDGSQVMFGKYIDTDGAFKGLFAGRYGDGRFASRWLVQSGEHGVLGGFYRETAPGPEVGGVFIGRWAERGCSLDMDPGDSL